MKRPGLSLALLSATLFLILSSSNSLRAQEMMTPSPVTKASKRADELMKRFDTNRDGRLDDDERANAKEAMLTEQVERQMARAAALPGGLEAFRTQALQMFDTNRDGRLDEEERNAARTFAARRQNRRGETDAMERRFDQNGNGTIDPEERAMIERFLSTLRAEDAAPTPKPADTPAATPKPSADSARRELEQAQMKAVREEVARRRAEREAKQESRVAPK